MISETSKKSLPALPIVVKDSENTHKIMHVLRHFHLGNPAATEQLEPLGDSFLPALLAPYRDISQLRYDYPLYLCPIEATAVETDQNCICSTKSISLLIQEQIDAFSETAESARILRDSLPWIEWELRIAAREIEGPTPVIPLLTKVCKGLSEHLQLADDDQQTLQADIDRLIESIPEEGLLLGYGRFPALHLLMYQIRSQVLPQLNFFKKETEQYIKNLRILLDVDDSKHENASSSKMLESNITSNHFFNTESLSKIIKHSHGSITMSASRRQRIEDALDVLEKFKKKETLVHIIHSSTALDNSWLDQNKGFTIIHHDEPCTKATDIFDQEAQELAKVFSAARIAKLELENAYDENIHDPWFNNFNWEAFSKKELILVPSIIILESADRLVDESMVSFSHLLNSGRPINIFVRVQAHNNPGAKAGEDPFQSYRTELGYMGISHRQAVVTQSSAARHEHLLKHFNTALNATRTSLHLINVGLRETGQEVGLNAWLVAGAALEGRAHPFFSVNPGAGDSAADRMDFEGNPQPEKDWPGHRFSFLNEGGDVSEIDLDFTFADYSLLIPRLYHHFGLIPAECESDDLLPVAEYLSLPADEVDNFVPYILAVNKYNELRKLAISRALIHACRDRLNFWHSLQEMAGVRSRYVEEAEKRIHAEADEEIKQQVAQVKSEFDTELQRIKTETASEVMSRLTDILLGMDLTPGGFGGRIKPAETSSSLTIESPEDSQETAVDDKNNTKAIVEEDDSFDETWVDTPLCTSCNDCLGINPQVFAYNDSKQAIITDLKAGSYSQIVEAAEICPSMCIHPGKPWDESEAGLDELILRAKAIG